MNRLTASAAGLVIGLSCWSCSDTFRAADLGGPRGDGVTISKLFDADFPVSIAFAPDGRYFYTEKNTGNVRVVKNGALLSTPFATLPINAAGHRGLLGIALHPDFANNGWVYVAYTVTDGTPQGASGNRVSRLVADGDVSDGTETTIIDLPASATTYHNVGNIRFGADGKLYVSMGELNDPPTAAQDTSSLKGKILRLNEDGSIPDDNPMPGNPLYAYGVRNSFDLAFDPISGDLFATENGDAIDDEVNHILPGKNYGWPNVEGMADTGAEMDFADSTADYVDPILTKTPVVAPTGIDFAPNALFGKDKMDDLFYGEYKTGRVWRVELNDARDAMMSESQFVIGISGGITDVAFAPDGTMYVLTATAIWHITPAQ